MRLTIKNISAFLMEKGLLKAKSVVDGDFMVVQTQNRNAIFRIHIKNDKSLFVKQLVNFDPQNTYFLQKDATCLWLIKNEKTFKDLSQFVPEYYGYDPEKQVLIVEYLPDAKNLEEIYQMHRKIDPAVLDQAAKILTSFHFKLEDKTLTNRAVQFFMKQLPWTFQFALAPENSNAPTYGPNPVIEYVKNNASFKSLMKEIAGTYEFNTLIHGDIKNVNFILPQQEEVSSLKLIDWELADIGDPLWDAAGFIQSLLVSQVVVMTAPIPQQQTQPISQQQMMQSIQEIGHFWKSYCKYKKWEETAGKKALAKTIKFAGMRMVQTAFEHNTTSQQLLPNTIKILQICHSLMQNTDTIVSQIIQPQNKQHEPVS